MTDSKGRTVLRKSELAALVAAKLDVSQDQGGKALDAVVDVVCDALALGQVVNITGFGSFDTRPVAARTAPSPQDKTKTISVPAHMRAAFKPGKTLKDAVKDIPVAAAAAAD